MLRHKLQYLKSPGIFSRRLVKGVKKYATEPHRFRASLYYLAHPAAPLFTPRATEFLEKYLQPEMKIFEWGAGRSTMFFATRGAKLVSIEHDLDWYNRLGNQLKRKNLDNVDLRLVEPDYNSEEDALTVGRLPGLLHGSKYLSYVKAIDVYTNNYFDLVVVDGRERSACLLNAMSKVKPGGLLMLDDSQRERYLPASAVLEKLHWVARPMPYGFNQTTAWEKPESLNSVQ